MSNTLKPVNCKICPDLCQTNFYGELEQQFYLYAESYGDVSDESVLEGAVDSGEITEDDLAAYWDQMDKDSESFKNKYGVEIDPEASESCWLITTSLPHGWKNGDGPKFSTDQLIDMINSTFKSIHITGVDEDSEWY